MSCCGKNSDTRLLEDQDSQVELEAIDIQPLGRCTSAAQALPNCGDYDHYTTANEVTTATPTVNQIVLTGRTLFLRESLNSRVVARNCNAGETNPLNLYTYNRTYGWNGETYTGLLKLTDAILAGLEGRTILDIGGGQSLFPEEAYRLGINVRSIDINFTTYRDARDTVIDQDTQETNLQRARTAYVTNMEAVHCFNQRSSHGNFIHNDVAGTFNFIFGHRRRIANDFMNLALRQEGNALNLPFVANSFDGVCCVWVFCYLNAEQIQTAIWEAVRVTKRGGQIRIYGGEIPYTMAEPSVTAQLYRNWFGTARVATKTIAVNVDSQDGLLVLDVM